MKKSTIKWLNRSTKKAYKAARQLDIAIEQAMDNFWNWVFPDKPKSDKSENVKPKVRSTAYPNGKVITYTTES